MHKIDNFEEMKTSRLTNELLGLKLLKPMNPERGFFKLNEEEIRFYSNGEWHPKGYFIWRLLGKGNAAIVWLCEHVHDDLTVAAK